MSAPARTRRIAVVGARAVGKSSITVQFVEDHFVESYYPTIEGQFSKRMKYKGQDYLVEILDTAGQDEFSIMSQKHLVGIHGYVFVYSVASRASFTNIDVIRDKILNSLGGDHVPGVMVGNKSDLHIQRQIPEDEAREKSKQLEVAFIETSARHNENVQKAFELALAEIEKKQNPPQPESSNCVIT